MYCTQNVQYFPPSMNGCIEQPLLLCFRFLPLLLVFFDHSFFKTPVLSVQNVYSAVLKGIPLSFKWRQTAASWPVGFALCWTCFTSWYIGLCISRWTAHSSSYDWWVFVFFSTEDKTLTTPNWHSSHVNDDLSHLHCFSLLCQSSLSNSCSCLGSFKTFLMFTLVFHLSATGHSVCSVVKSPNKQCLFCFTEHLCKAVSSQWLRSPALKWW